ncbi:MAG: 3'-5' exonuclease, partial [Planctomycetia bacterium]|nr:3'-5' exonuclease [Planctomycetia bacterium]
LSRGDLLSRISRWKMAGTDADEAEKVAEVDLDHLAAIAYRRYQNAMYTAGAVDFDDLLLCVERLFREFPDVLESEAGRFDHLLVDEYQDTNGSQYRIVKSLAQGHRNLCVVGDDDQSIYAWRGAEVTHILRFRRDWPGARVISLEDNYRSTREIVTWANRLIACNPSRHPKVLRAHRDGPSPRILQLPDEEEEAHTIIAEIVMRICKKERSARDFAILFRTNDQVQPFESELRRCGVPYTLIGGQSFYDHREIRDILAYLKVISHPGDDVSLLRILNTPPRGIGQTTIRRLMDRALETKQPLWTILQSERELSSLNRTASHAIRTFVAMIRKYRMNALKESPSMIVSSLIEEIHYRDEIQRICANTNEQNSRNVNVDRLISAAERYGKRTRGSRLSGFVQEMSLSDRDMGDDKERLLAKDAVILMTLHAAKGLEFPVVYMVGLEEFFHTVGVSVNPATRLMRNVVSVTWALPVRGNS